MNSEDMSDIFEKLNGVIDKDKISPDMVNNLLSMLGNNSDTNNDDNINTNSDDFNSQESNSSNNSIDMETLLKMKTIIDKMNTKDDPRSNLLLSLKPYLKDSRKDKLDQYIQLMNMSKVIEIFPFMGGGKKKDG